MSLMKYGSNNYYKQKVKVAKLHEHIANQRLDWIHKLSTELANEYDYICVEDINMQNMAQSLKLGKSTCDNGFGMFRTILGYKLADRGKILVKIDKWFPSSKMCRHCGCMPTKEGYDACLGHIEGATSACCGHGVNKSILIMKS